MMLFRIVFLELAEKDLIDLKGYITHHFSKKNWTACYSKIKKTIRSLRDFPEAGTVIPELAALNLLQYRQIISGMNRIIYEIQRNTVYIHIICDVRCDLTQSLVKRALLI